MRAAGFLLLLAVLLYVKTVFVPFAILAALAGAMLKGAR